MFYINYLESTCPPSARGTIHVEKLTIAPGLCRRRRWSDPHYGAVATGSGYAASVSVNGREYRTEPTYGTEELAREAAAMKAYLICRNLSVSEGLPPANFAVSVSGWS